MIARLTLTLIVTISLTLMYKLYNELVTPLVQPQYQALSPEQLFSEPGVQQGPREHADMATKYLAHAPWAASAKIKFRHENLYIYCGQWEQSDAQTMTFSPFAVIWKVDGKDGKPETCYSLETDQARLDFEEPVNLTEFNPNLLKTAELHGQVKLTGPDEMEVVGQNFIFERDAQHVRSDFPIKFRYDRHTGNSRGIEMELIPTDEFNPNPQLSFSGVKNVSFKTMAMALAVDDNRPPAQVTCDGLMTYDITHQIAELAQNVQVRQQTHPQEFDTLTCNHLLLQFSQQLLTPSDPVPASESTNPAGSSKLGLERLFAEGNFVVIRSDHQQLTSAMETLEYRVHEKELILQSSNQPVTVNLAGTEIVCPKIQLWNNDQKDLEAAQATGAGWIRHFDVDGQTPIAEVNWHEMMRLQPDQPPSNRLTDRYQPRRYDRIDILGNAALTHHTQQALLVGQSMSFWIERKPASSENSSANSSDVKRPPMSVRLHKMVAQNQVKLVSSQLDTTTDLLELNFREEDFSPVSMLDPVNQTTSSASSQSSTFPDPAPSSGMTEPLLKTAISVTCRQIVGQVRLSPRLYASQQSSARPQDLVDLADLVAIGQVHMHQEKTLQSPPWSVSGAILHLENKGQFQQTIRLKGEIATRQQPATPAIIEHDRIHLEGPELIFERDQNRCQSIGESMVQMPVNNDFEGNQLGQTSLMTIRCHESIDFDGQTGRFIGSVQSWLADGQIHCGELQAKLNRKIIFTQRLPQDAELKLQEVIAKEQVRVEMNHYQAGQLIHMLKGTMDQCAIDVISGQISGRGPGKVLTWNYNPPKADNSLSRLGVKANAPAKTDNKEWNYISLDFEGDFDGNLYRRLGTLNRRIRCVYGPVEKPLELLDRDNLPDNAGVLECDKMTGRLITEDWQGPFQVTAEDNTELWGNLFQTQSDILSYDSQTALFGLNSKQDRTVKIWIRAKRGAPYDSPFEAVGCKFGPENKTIEIDRMLGTQGSLMK